MTIYLFEASNKMIMIIKWIYTKPPLYKTVGLMRFDAFTFHNKVS